LEKAGELENRPTYFPERFSIVSWIADIREQIGSVNTSASITPELWNPTLSTRDLWGIQGDFT